MTPKLPVVSGEELIRALEKTGYHATRQKGSHVRMRDETNPRRKPVSVPLHRELKRGLLRKILRDAELSVERLVELL
jgi:predicted RNA binding protein YcfA (HicA-like mRNA interferase family)